MFNLFTKTILKSKINVKIDERRLVEGWIQAIQVKEMYSQPIVKNNAVIDSNAMSMNKY
jgi:hypothetical protein